MKEKCLQHVPTISTTSVPDLEPDVAPPCKKHRGLAAGLLHISSEEKTSQAPVTPLQTVMNEIASYQEFPSSSPETDPLVWWKGEEGRFPNLACLAHKYLCVCGTSVPSERIFSRAGCVANPACLCLRPENVDKLVFLSNNLS